MSVSSQTSTHFHQTWRVGESFHQNLFQLSMSDEFKALQDPEWKSFLRCCGLSSRSIQEVRMKAWQTLQASTFWSFQML